MKSEKHPIIGAMVEFCQFPLIGTEHGRVIDRIEDVSREIDMRVQYCVEVAPEDGNRNECRVIGWSMVQKVVGHYPIEKLNNP